MEVVLGQDCKLTKALCEEDLAQVVFLQGAHGQHPVVREAQVAGDERSQPTVAGDVNTGVIVDLALRHNHVALSY